MTQNKKLLMNATDMAVYLGIKQKTMYNMIQDGRFPVPAVKGTSPRLWRIEDIDAWYNNRGDF